MTIKYYSRVMLNREIYKHIKEVDTILDIGCGIRPQMFFKPINHICCEPFGEYVDELKRLSDKNKSIIVIQKTAQEVAEKFPKDSIESIFLLDVIEHIEKNEALRLIERFKNIARCQVIIGTTLGFRKQEYKNGEKDSWGYHGVYWQTHRSGWSPSDFSSDWEILISERYYYIDDKWDLLNKPDGYLWAIYNKNINGLKSTKRNFYSKVQFRDRLIGFMQILKIFPNPLRHLITSFITEIYIKVDKRLRGVH